MESNSDEVAVTPEAKGRTHTVPESVLIKEEAAEMNFDRVVDEEDVELAEDTSVKGDADQREETGDESDIVEKKWDEHEPKVELLEYDNDFDPKVNPEESDGDFDPKEEPEEGDEEVAAQVKEELWDWEFNDFKVRKKVKGKRIKTEYGAEKYQTVTELRKQVRNLKSMLNKCRQEKKAMKTPKENKVKNLVREYIAKHHSKVWASFMVDNKSDRPGNWTEQEVLRAIGLRRISKKAYIYMRDNRLCPLPGNATLRNWVKCHPEWDVPTPAEYIRPAAKKPNTQRQRGTGNVDHMAGSDVNPCGQCGHNFPQKALLNKHLAEVHGDERAKKMQCHVCDKWLANQTMMVGHQNMHMNIRPFPCDFCDRTYRTQANMAAHRKEAHAEQWKIERGKRSALGRAAPKPCTKCGMLFPLLSALNQHLAEFHGDVDARELQCTTCDKWLGSKLLLQNHMRTHTGERPFKCDFCPKSFFSDKTMTAHRKERHQIEWEANKEMILERNKEQGRRKMVAARAKRKRNISVTDNGEAPILDETTGMVNEDLFKCDFCDKAYITKNHMVAHRKEAHDEEWKDEVWRQKAVTYASSNPCPICGMIFPIQSMLNEHLAKIHEDPEAMELQCTYCTKWLGSKQLLSDHIRTHTGERPYKCDFCPKAFATSKSMGKHRTTVHYEAWEANKDQIMARNRALAMGKRYKDSKANICGEDNGEAAILDEATGMIYN